MITIILFIFEQQFFRNLFLSYFLILLVEKDLTGLVSSSKYY